jgi:hypothetical protein
MASVALGYTLYMGIPEVKLRSLAAALLMTLTMARPGPAWSETDPNPIALELVDAMSFDDFVADAAALGARKAFADGLLDQQQFNCVILQASEWRAYVAQYFSRFLTEDDLAASARFFRSEAGNWLILSIFEERDARRRGDKAFKRKAPEKKLEADLNAFLESSAAKKLFNTGSVFDEANVQQLAKDRIGVALKNCPGTKTKAGQGAN